METRCLYAYSLLRESLTETKFDLVFLFAHSCWLSWMSDNLLASGFRSGTRALARSVAKMSRNQEIGFVVAIGLAARSTLALLFLS